MKEQFLKKKRREKRLQRIRKKILKTTKTGKKPRLVVYRSNKYFYAQIIDDLHGTTLTSGNERGISEKGKLTKSQKAALVGEVIAKKAKEKHIRTVVFDKGFYKYHGRIKAFAQAARAGGLVF